MPKILIVEDDSEAREMLAAILKCAGYGVITAENGLDALSRACSEGPALILTDLEMPDVGGIEMICRLRSDETQLGGVPIIAMSAYASPLELAPIVGASESLLKPFSIQALLARIEQLLSPATVQPTAR